MSETREFLALTAGLAADFLDSLDDCAPPPGPELGWRDLLTASRSAPGTESTTG